MSELAKNAANYRALTPLDFLVWASRAYPRKTAVIDGERRFTYSEFAARCRRLASALAGQGIVRGDTVAVLAPNIPATLEAHYGVPMLGAVLNALNIRLDAASIAFILGHGGAKILIVDAEFASVARAALEAMTGPRPMVVEVTEPGTGLAVGEMDYEELLGAGDPAFVWTPPSDEWQSLALNYTSGTTGDPKGVVYHHRGAFLNALANAMTFGLTARSVYLWTLPMFHCNGWSYPWAVTAVGGTHVCLRRIDPVAVLDLIERHSVTHFCAAPIILNMLMHAEGARDKRFSHRVQVATGGAAPPSTVIAAMEGMGIEVTHLYGLTESYGPATVCLPQEDWQDKPLAERAGLMARQGLPHFAVPEMMVADSETLAPVPADGATIGELVFRGHTLMKGYLANPKATDAAFAGGWFHSGDLAVQHPDGYVEIKDRAKDIIISGGENISSLEVEEVLYRHPSVLEAAVVARPDATWGETPCAFIALKPGIPIPDANEIIGFCRQNLAHFKCPRTVVFGELPKTATGKIQKFTLRQQAGEL
ncbi:MAG: acyl-CoA synthetase [Rhodospirillales bacterium]|nr:acyl-CoA synthetase [Rhodospirillales bacterium]